MDRNIEDILRKNLSEYEFLKVSSYINKLGSVVKAARCFDDFARRLEASKIPLGANECAISRSIRLDLHNAIDNLDGDSNVT